jgi:hypothetical protein
MPDTVQHVQGRHVRRCVVVANGNLQTLAIAALNTQAAGRGDAIAAWLIGVRIVSASAGFTVSNPDGTGTLTIATASVPYDIAATDGMDDTLLGGGANLGVEVYYTGNQFVP